MKRTTKVFLLAFADMFGAGIAFAQVAPVKANVPFDFNVGARHLSAGTYRFLSVMQGVVAIESEETQASILIDVFSASEPTSNNARLIFNNDGDQYFLCEILGGPAAVNALLPPSGSEETTRLLETMAHNQSQISVAAEGI